MRVLLCGSRNWSRPDMIREVLSELPYHAVVVVGDCPTGADAQARYFANHLGLRVEVYKADWDAHGKAAGPVRNRRMVEDGKPEFAFGFTKGESRGTMNCIRQCRKKSIPSYLITEDGETAHLGTGGLPWEQLTIGGSEANE